MKKIFLGGALCAIMTAPAFATYGTEMNTTLDDARAAIERIDNSWDAMRDLRVALNGSSDPMTDLVAWAKTENTTSAYENETDNIGVVNGIINDTAFIMQGYYTNAVLANDAIAANADAIALNSAAISRLENTVSDIEKICRPVLQVWRHCLRLRYLMLPVARYLWVVAMDIIMANRRPRLALRLV